MEEERFKAGDIVRMPDNNQLKGLKAVGVVRIDSEGRSFIETLQYTVQVSLKYMVLSLASEEEKEKFVKAMIAEKDRYDMMIELIQK